MNIYRVTILSISLVLAGASSVGAESPVQSLVNATTLVALPSTQDESKSPEAESDPKPEVLQHPDKMPKVSESDGLEKPAATPSVQGITLETLEQLALAQNPVIGQAQARVRALRGKCLQVGLPPNPEIGYMAGEVGNEGSAGQQGLYVAQDFIRGGKLKKNRAVVAAEIEQAEQVLVAAQRRVRTDVRRLFYRALVAQNRVKFAVLLEEAARKAVDVSKSLVEAKEISLAGLLQSEILLHDSRLVLNAASNHWTSAWNGLAAVAGGAELQPTPLLGDPTVAPDQLHWEEVAARLEAMSPEIAQSMANLTRARCTLQRAYVEAVPDISAQLSVQFDDSTNDTIAGVQVGLPIPLWNRNQGGIQQARANVTEAAQNVERVALDLQNRLANAFRDYATASQRAKSYATEILPRAQSVFDLTRESYSHGEVGTLDLLTAQRTYAQTNLAYLDALDQLWTNWARIDGLLLEGSLEAMPE